MARPIVAIFLAIVIPTWVGWVLVSSWSGSEARRILLLAPAYVVSAVLAQLTLGLDAAPPEGRFVGLLFGSAIIGLASVSPDGYRLIGRFWMALVLISSYCYTTLMSVDMAFDRAPPETVRTVVTAKETRKMTVGRFWLEVHPEGRARRSSATARRIEVSEQVFEAASVGQPVVTTWGRGLLSYRWLRDVRPAEVDPTAMTRGAPQ
ncbi:MAG: hypothetical protein HY815_05465 [Candidatus Riflebacteria bacterium]|nr:hypothetical protein [Candidatus Riflebacteria bacterium]